MIALTEILVRGQSEAGPFEGGLSLTPGLQVISARNAYGKSLAVTAVAWCLGLEGVLGNLDNDPSCFPDAVRHQLDLAAHPAARVYSSECSIEITDENQRHIRLTRAIKGDTKFVRVKEWANEGATRESKLWARHHTMQDEHGGLQHFLFEWLKWPREKVSTSQGPVSEVYLENLAPTFYIAQTEGWTNIQALQIFRYRQQEIAEISVEYLLGDTDAVKNRFARQESIRKNEALRETARQIGGHVEETFLRFGWRIEWSGQGSISEIVTRWSSRTLLQALKEDLNIDLNVESSSLELTAGSLRKSLTTDPIDPSDASAVPAASQRVIDLKERRHSLSVELHTSRIQRGQTEELLRSLEHRIDAATDLLQLKTSGVGRFEHVECPTCHRDLDPSTFSLTDQSSESVRNHIEALKRDRDLMRRNLQSLDANAEISNVALVETEDELRAADRSLMNVTNAIGTAREKFVQIASDLNKTERRIERIRDAGGAIQQLQNEVSNWLIEANLAYKTEFATPDSNHRRMAFLDAFRKYLVALGHSEVKADSQSRVDFNEQYVPELNNRRLSALGSASDKSRLVAAYSLGLASASQFINGLHPGLVIFDEPFQQNPDDPHRDMFISFLSAQLARQAKFQTLIFTSLHQTEIEQLRQQGTTVLLPEGDHFLKLTAT